MSDLMSSPCSVMLFVVASICEVILTFDICWNLYHILFLFTEIKYLPLSSRNALYPCFSMINFFFFFYITILTCFIWRELQTNVYTDGLTFLNTVLAVLPRPHTARDATSPSHFSQLTALRDCRAAGFCGVRVSMGCQRRQMCGLCTQFTFWTYVVGDIFEIPFPPLILSFSSLFELKCGGSGDSQLSHKRKQLCERLNCLLM